LFFYEERISNDRRNFVDVIVYLLNK